MLRKIGAQITTLVMLLLLTSPGLIAQTRIRFRPGRSSATVAGTLARGATRSYIVRARAGQTVRMFITSRNGRVTFADNEATEEFFRADETRDYEISVMNNGRATPFTLRVAIR